MKCSFKLKMKPTDEILKARGLEEHGRVQTILDSEVVRLCSPYVPVDTHTLQRSASLATDFGSGEVVYQTPYARRIYYTHKGEKAHSAKPQDRRAGKLWLERMKADCMDELKKVVEKASGGECK